MKYLNVKKALAAWRDLQPLSEKDRESWRNFCALRLLNPPADKALTYELYMRTIEEKLNSLDTNAKEKMILLRLREYGEELYDRILR